MTLPESPAKFIMGQIAGVNSKLIGLGVSTEQNQPCLSQRGRLWTIRPAGETVSPLTLKGSPYAEVYAELSRTRSFNIKLLDGALMLFHYTGDNKAIHTHNLAFLPSPSLEEFQNNPEIYERDEIYADIIEQSRVPFPLRFDFDHDRTKHRKIDHPHSHLTLGQYSNCRIPVSAPLTPYIFAHFIVRNFYNTLFRTSDADVNFAGPSLEPVICAEERTVPHLVVP